MATTDSLAASGATGEALPHLSLCACGRPREALAANGEPDCALHHAAARWRFETALAEHDDLTNRLMRLLDQAIQQRQGRDDLLAELKEVTAALELEAHPRATNEMGRHAILRQLQAERPEYDELTVASRNASKDLAVTEAHLETLRYRLRLVELSMRWELAAREEARA